MQVINVKSAVRNYAANFVDSTSYIKKLREIPSRFFVIDENVWRIYGDNLFANMDPHELLVLPIHEDKKNIESVMEIYDALMSRAAKRNMTLISIGGGITQDITGFAASTLYRGINWIFVPTTLLAQADSCIGSKTSLNYRRYKNLIGSFFPPNEIFIDPGYLGSLIEDDFYSGLGEVVKLHLMGGAGATQTLIKDMDALHRRDPATLSRAVYKSLEIKLSYIAGDEFDTGRRNLLNFGHCFGHALESTSEFAVPHGQAVLIGILFANIVAKNRRKLSEAMYRQLNDSTLIPNVMVRPRREHMNIDAIEAAMKMDKKRMGEGLVLVMQEDGFEMTKVSDLSRAELSEATDELQQLVAL